MLQTKKIDKEIEEAFKRGEEETKQNKILMKELEKKFDKANLNLDLEGIRQLLIYIRGKYREISVKGEIDNREMYIHKCNCMTGYGTLGYLFFGLIGSPPKLYAVFRLGKPYNPETDEVTGSLDINGEKKIERITLRGIQEIKGDTGIVIGEIIKEV